MDKKEIEVNGKRIVYTVTGNGPTVVLIHGFGELADVWQSQVEFLKDKFRLIIPDLPGSGESEMVDDMSIEGMATVIKIILDAEWDYEEYSSLHNAHRQGELKRACIIGHSMGGYVTLAFAEKYPEYLKAFGLFHSTAFADSEEKKAVRRKGIDFILEHGAFEFLKNTTPNLFSPHTQDKIPELIDKQIKTLNNFSASALVSYYEAMIQRPDRTAILRNSTLPVLFIAGISDNAVQLSDVLKLCHLPSLSYIHTLAYSGHMGMLEESQKSNLVLKDFFEKATFNQNVNQ